MDLQEQNKNDNKITNKLFINKNDVKSDCNDILNDFYEKGKDKASELIAVSILRQIFENGLLNDEEYFYIKEKYYS